MHPDALKSLVEGTRDHVKRISRAILFGRMILKSRRRCAASSCVQGV